MPLFMPRPIHRCRSLGFVHLRPTTRLTSRQTSKSDIQLTVYGWYDWGGAGLKRDPLGSESGGGARLAKARSPNPEVGGWPQSA